MQFKWNLNFQVFVYHFGYRGQNSHTQLDVYNWPPKVVPKPVLFGVGNGDDLIYLFPVLSGTFRQLSHDDLVFSQQFIQLLSSFAKDSQPRVKMSDPSDEIQIPDFIWHPVNKNGQEFSLLLCLTTFLLFDKYLFYIMYLNYKKMSLYGKFQQGKILNIGRF